MKKLSEAQVRVLTALVDATEPVLFYGWDKRTLESLKRQGLVTFKTKTVSSQTFYYGGSVYELYATITPEGRERLAAQ